MIEQSKLQDNEHYWILSKQGWLIGRWYEEYEAFEVASNAINIVNRKDVVAIDFDVIKRPVY